MRVWLAAPESPAPVPSYVFGSGFYHDPIARPGDRREMDGRPMVGGGTSQARQVTPGYPAFIATGRAAPEVKYLAVTQDGHEDRRPLRSHFGAWVVCTEQPGPFEVAGIDQNGTVLASLRYPRGSSGLQEFHWLPARPGVVALTASLLRTRRHETRPPNSSHPNTTGYQFPREFSLTEGSAPGTRGSSGSECCDPRGFMAESWGKRQAGVGLPLYLHQPSPSCPCRIPLISRARAVSLPPCCAGRPRPWRASHAGSPPRGTSSP
jgi:hypothetical protein